MRTECDVCNRQPANESNGKLNLYSYEVHTYLAFSFSKEKKAVIVSSHPASKNEQENPQKQKTGVNM